MQTNPVRKGLTGAHFKWIAIVFMAIDHIGAALVEPVLLNATVTAANLEQIQRLSDIYMVLRCIGRFSFPAFCFLLVEGFHHTRSKANYLRNLLIFALISEVPFDLALRGDVLNLDYQNVFFTLAAGFVAIWIADYWNQKSITEPNRDFMYRVLTACVVIAIAYAAEILNTDYGAVGVATIFILHALHHKPVMSAVMAWVLLSITNWLEIFCFPFILAVKFYNGQRGRQNKYLFYIFYPAHLLLLFAIRTILF